MKERKTAERCHLQGAEAPITRWDDPRLMHIHPQPEGSGQFDPCRVFETLERILSRRKGSEVHLTGTRATPEAVAREKAYWEEQMKKTSRDPAVPAAEGV